MTQKDSYLPHVDGLRAVAILSVLAYHAWPSLVPGGFLGVDVFFVISGYLITRQLYGAIRDGRFSYFGFIAQRMRRLLPAAVVCFLFVSIIGGFVLLPDAYKEYGRSLASAALIYANFYFYDRTGYFEAPANEKPLLHTWSLAVEDQFYLLWPLILLGLAVYLRRRWMIAAITGLAAASFIYAKAMLGSDASYAFYMLAPRAWELMTGALLAIAAPQAASRAPLAPWFGAAGLTMIIAGFFIVGDEARAPGFYAVPVCLGTAMAIASGVMRASSPAIALLASRPAVFVGLISYSLYLWHWPLLALSRYGLGRSLTTPETLLVLAVSFAAAYLSWRFVETPFRSAKLTRLTPVLRRGAGAMGITALCGLVIVLTDGLPGRFPPAVSQIFVDMSGGNPRRAACDGVENIFRKDAACNFGVAKPEGASFDVALFGDSNADHFAPFLAEWAKANSFSARQVTQSQCGPVFGARRERLSASLEETCEDYHAQALAFINRNEDLKIAVLSGNWPTYGAAITPNAAAADLAADLTSESDFDDYMRRIVEMFEARGIKVLIIGRIPHYEVLPVRCVVDAVAAKRDPALCGLDREHATRGLSRTQPVFESLARGDPNVVYIDPINLLCDDERCSPLKDGVFVYRDRGHLSAAGATYLGRLFDLSALAAASPHLNEDRSSAKQAAD